MRKLKCSLPTAKGGAGIKGWLFWLQFLATSPSCPRRLFWGNHASRCWSQRGGGEGDSGRSSQGADDKEYGACGEFKHHVKAIQVCFCYHYRMPVINYPSLSGQPYPHYWICRYWVHSWCLVKLHSSFFLLSCLSFVLSTWGWQINFKPLANSNWWWQSGLLCWERLWSGVFVQKSALLDQWSLPWEGSKEWQHRSHVFAILELDSATSRQLHWASINCESKAPPTYDREGGKRERMSVPGITSPIPQTHTTPAWPGAPWGEYNGGKSGR